MSRPVVTLLTDYGHEDDFVGVCHGVILGICPGAAVVDVTHGIPRHSVRHGALVMRNTLPYLPRGVHVAIVDPQVGTERRALAVRTGDGRLLVGPDNGVLSLAWQRAGGAAEAIDVTRSPHRLEPVSATFHGRDVFAPVAAHLASGEELREAGEPLGVEELELLELPRPRLTDDGLVAHALLTDRFGNVALDAGHEELAGSGIRLGQGVEVEVAGERYLATFAQTFADVRPGDVLLYEDSYRTLAIALNRGDAAATLQIGMDAEIRLRPR
ncbi:MAG: SAM-dependent chlorinase/fluorinase [Thermoleophilaceae bacterium]